jgi:hypothetical protein
MQIICVYSIITAKLWGQLLSGILSSALVIHKKNFEDWQKKKFKSNYKSPKNKKKKGDSFLKLTVYA